MNKYLQAGLLLGFIILNETAPFLYNDAYTIKDIKWGWIVGFPLLLLIANSFMKSRDEDQGKE